MPQTLRCLSRLRIDGLGGACRHVRFLSRLDVLALLRGEPRMVLGRVIEAEPRYHPHQRNRAGDHERQAPAVEQDGPGDQGCRQHRAERGADVVETAGEAALLRRKPLGHRLHPAGLRRTFGHAHEPAQRREHGPAGRRAVQHHDHRPRQREQAEAELQADEVHDVADDGLQHDAGLEESRDPGVFLLGDPEVSHDRRRGHAEHRARHVVQDRADGDQADHPPAQRVQPTNHASPFDFGGYPSTGSASRQRRHSVLVMHPIPRSGIGHRPRRDLESMSHIQTGGHS